MMPVDPATSNQQGDISDRRRQFSLRQRIALALVSALVYLVIRVLGATLRFAWSEEEGATAERIARPAIYSFWHQCIFPAAALFRGQGIAVMTSLSFDGEFIARVIERFQNLNVLPRRVIAEFGIDATIHIQVDVCGLPEEQLKIIAAKIGSAASIVSAHWHRL